MNKRELHILALEFCADILRQEEASADLDFLDDEPESKSWAFRAEMRAIAEGLGRRAERLRRDVTPEGEAERLLDEAIKQIKSLPTE